MTATITIIGAVNVSVVLSGGVRWVFPTLAVFAVMAVVLFFSLRSPLHGQQRCRLLLDLIESGLQQGVSPERFLASLAKLQDSTVDPLFYWLAARLEMGERLPVALGKIPKFANPAFVALLGIGQEIGNYQAVLPACRQTLDDPGAECRVATNYYYFGLAGLANGTLLLLPQFLSVFGAVLTSCYSGSGQPVPAQWLRSLCFQLWFVNLTLLLLFIAGVTWHELNFSRSLRAMKIALADRVSVRLHWRTPQYLRDFIGALALLLDAGVPESRAVGLAAGTLDNLIWQKRARAVRAALQTGATLTEAIQKLDKAGELRWRLENGARAGHGFTRALGGWQELLASQAFRQQQMAAQVITTALLVFTGVTVAACAALTTVWISGLSRLVR